MSFEVRKQTEAKSGGKNNTGGGFHEETNKNIARGQTKPSRVANHTLGSFYMVPHPTFKGSTLLT